MRLSATVLGHSARPMLASRTAPRRESKSMSSNARRCLTIVLAAGEGVRMRSARPKVLHEIAGRSMLAHVLAAVREAGAGDVAVVVGPDRDDVAAEALKAAPEAQVFVQRERRGTAHAVLAAREAIARGYDDILVTYADIPLLRGATLAAHARRPRPGRGARRAWLRAADPTGYGRLIERDGRLVAIREHKDANADERAARLCNAGPSPSAGPKRCAPGGGDARQCSGRILPDRPRRNRQCAGPRRAGAWTPMRPR